MVVQGSTGSAMSGNRAALEQVVQRVRFAGPRVTVPDDLYVVADRGTIRRERTRLLLAEATRATTQTYFGRFPAAYYQRWTTATSVAADVTLSGPARVELHASDFDGEARTLDVVVVDSPQLETVRLSTTLDRYLDGGSLWIDFESEAHPISVESLHWCTPEPDNDRRTSIVICTYNRPQDCLETMRTLAQDDDVLDIVEHLYVVDQGSDTVESQSDFTDLAKHFGDMLRYLRQPNLGGAGGFTRGLFEITDAAKAEHANVLLMDDDIVLEPETVLRMTAFANHAEKPIIVGGQMLYLLHPHRIHRGAEQADLRTLNPEKVPGSLEDVDLTSALPHARIDAQYNGWWSCMIPAEAVRTCGLPLPYFFQWDDIEYGIRAARQGVPTVTLPGAAVWHADFAWKDYDDWARYFSFRNGLITSAVHGELEGRAVVAALGRNFASYVAGMQYGLAATLLKAIEDFLTGPQILRDGGVEAAATVRELRQLFPDTTRHGPADIPSRVGAENALLTDEDREPRLPMALVLKRLGQHLLSRSGRTAFLPAGHTPWWHVSLFRTAVVTDSGQDAVRIRTFDRPTVLRLSAEGAVLFTRLARESAAMQGEWQQAVPELTSRDNWRRLFEL